jgi:hypothetical protein
MDASAGLLVTRTVEEARRGESFYFAWLLQHEAFLRFGCDPGAALSERTDEYGFRE